MLQGNTTTDCTSQESINELPLTEKSKIQKKKRQFCLRSPPPSQHLKKILSNYPEGPQIFFEALQNADDAKADAFRVVLDERTHKCLCPLIDRFMGPAILFQNDAVFSERDWASLQNMFESAKSEEAGKIGRFGMGSRSYFHMSVLSGHHIAFLDPDWTISEDGGMASHLKDLQANLDNCETLEENDLLILKDLLAPVLAAAGVDHQHCDYFEGTLFRLPLRMGRWARNSTFAPYEYSASKALNLLQRFQKEAAESLLFLQSVKKIELWRWRESEDEAAPVFECKVAISAKTKESMEEEIALDRRGVIRDFLERHKNMGHDLSALFSTSEISSLPEIEETVEVCLAESMLLLLVFDFFVLFVVDTGIVLPNASNGFPFQLIEYTYPQQQQQQQQQVYNPNSKVKVESVVSTWLLNIQIATHSELIQLMKFVQRAPVVGIAILASPHYSTHEYITMPELKLTKQKAKFAEKVQKANLLSSSPVCPLPGSPKAHHETLKIRKRINWTLHDSLEDSIDVNDEANAPPELSGKTCAYLPLADVLSGLPVHIHGTFQLTDNRRSFWVSLDGTDGQARKWAEWNLILLQICISQLYARSLHRFSRYIVDCLDVLAAAADNTTQTDIQMSLNPEEAEVFGKKILTHYFNTFPNHNNMTPIFLPMLYELTRNIKDKRLMVRLAQSQAYMSSRLASRCQTSGRRSPNIALGLPPLRPTECQFVHITETESYIFYKEAETAKLLDEAVAQSQLLGHPVLLVPDSVKELLQLFDEDQSNNPAAINSTRSSKVNTNDQYAVRPHSRNNTKKKSGYYVISIMDLFGSILIPHWKSLPIKELPLVPQFSNLMLSLCKVLGRGADKQILKFRQNCSSLSFIPVRFPGVDYGEEEDVPLKSPIQCCDPSLDSMRVGILSQPDVNFRSPEVIRVLRLWGLRQTLGWTEMAQEAVGKMCTIGGCHSQRVLFESLLYR